MNSFGVTRVFRRTKRTQAQQTTSPLVVETNSSKLQNLLGISSRELTTARSQSISSSSTAKAQHSALSDATTIPVISGSPIDNDSSPDPLAELRSKSSSVLLHDNFEQGSATTGASSVQLESYPSSSSLHSHYDSKKAPLSVSQQTSNSSSRDFALRKGSRSVLSRRSQEMEHARQILFFKSPRSILRERRLEKLETEFDQTIGLPSTYGNRSAYNVAGEVQNSSSPAVAFDASQPPTTPARRFFQALKRSESQPMRAAPINPQNYNDPCAKVHIRRPKAGAKYWFEGHEGDSSDDENNNEPELEQAFVSEVQRVFGGPAGGSTETLKPPSHTISYYAESDISRSSKPSIMYRAIVSAESAPVELPAEQRTISRKVSFKTDRSAEQHSLRSKQSRSKLNVFRSADLNKQSVLNLSSSDDEDADEDEDEVAELPVPDRGVTDIRESLAEANIEESDVELGVAQLVKASPVESTPQLQHPRPEPFRKSPLIVPARASSRHASYLLDMSSEHDASESDIITSFPATPTDTGSLRTSIRSSMQSESGSLMSTRPMMVTKQEEKLLAAMRMKKAAMRRTDRDTDRTGALRVLESGGQFANTPTPRHHGHISAQTRPDVRLSNRYAPSRTHTHQRSLSEDDMASQSGYVRGSGTTFDTSVYSGRESQATIRTTFSDASQAPYSAYSYHENGTMTASPQSPRSAQHRWRDSNRRDTYFSIGSETSTHQRDSHVVMLDGLDEAMSREAIPSQLFMEAPFIGWDRVGVTAAH